MLVWLKSTVHHRVGENGPIRENSGRSMAFDNVLLRRY
jgi:hypothetical protein